jgi:hypothetical protein
MVMVAFSSDANRCIDTGGNGPWMAKKPATDAEADFPLTTLPGRQLVRENHVKSVTMRRPTRAPSDLSILNSGATPRHDPDPAR